MGMEGSTPAGILLQYRIAEFAFGIFTSMRTPKRGFT
jgi:hypothetical protein